MEYPEEGDLVIGTVRRITDYGAYVLLDEYGREGLVHISEISTSWVRNIRDHLREGQKLVLKVLRVNPSRGEVDLSIRRVTGRERTEKMVEWKKERRAETIFREVAGSLGASAEEAGSVRAKLVEKYDSLFEALRECAERGSAPLEKLGIPSQWSNALVEAAKEKIKPERVKVSATLEMRCHKPNGIELIKAALIKAKKAKKGQDSSVRIYTMGAPKYRIEVEAKGYQEAEKRLREAVETALKAIEGAGGRGSLLA
ncbi:MAG: translation initiation factor IF-2 subunit alpha [Candidatus Bathyarchaeia archaeon]